MKTSCIGRQPLIISANGRILKNVDAGAVSHEFTGGEQYARARVVNFPGQAAWAQPLFPVR